MLLNIPMVLFMQDSTKQSFCYEPAVPNEFTSSTATDLPKIDMTLYNSGVNDQLMDIELYWTMWFIKSM